MILLGDSAGCTVSFYFHTCNFRTHWVSSSIAATTNHIALPFLIVYLHSALLGSITKLGGPLVYLFVYMFLLFVILVCVDSGSRVFWRRTNPLSTAATAVADSDDILRISKSYGGKRVLGN